jgi:hypothetical protein
VTVAIRGTGPEKRLKVFMTIVELADLLGRRVSVFGLALSANAGAQTGLFVEQESLHAVSG